MKAGSGEVPTASRQLFASNSDDDAVEKEEDKQKAQGKMSRRDVTVVKKKTVMTVQQLMAVIVNLVLHISFRYLRPNLGLGLYSEENTRPD